MLNEWLLTLARWLDTHSWSTALHESIYMYAWVETTHVLTLAVFLGMLFVIDLRMLGLTFVDIPASKIAARLDTPMMLGFAVMLLTGLALYYAIPVRSTQSIWFRIKVLLLVAAGINASAVSRAHAGLGRHLGSWTAKPPRHIRAGAGLSLLLCGQAVDHYRSHHRL